jgi:hypothetical protein
VNSRPGQKKPNPELPVFTLETGYPYNTGRHLATPPKELSERHLIRHLDWHMGTVKQTLIGPLFTSHRPHNNAKSSRERER